MNAALWPHLLIVMVTAGLALESPLAQTPAAPPASQPAPSPAATDPLQMTQQARKLSNAGKLDEAVKLYEQALATDPKLYEAHLGLGIALDLQGKYDAARKHLEEAVALAPEDARAAPMGALAVSYVFEGKTDDAAKHYQKLFDFQIAGGNLDNAAATANALGRAHLEAGQIDKAEQWYRTGHQTASKIAELPADQIALWNLRWQHAQSRIAARRGQKEAAEKHAADVKGLVDKAGPSGNQLSDYHYLVGYVALHAGAYDRAIDALKQANQEDPYILALLAQAYEKKGEAALARETWKKVLASSAHSLQNALVRQQARKSTSG